MTVRIWNGSTASITTASDWSPAGMPDAGDIGIVSKGAVLADGLALDGFTLLLAGNGIGVAPTLELTDTTLGAAMHVAARYAGSSGTAPTAAINVNGIDTNAGQISAGTPPSAASLAILLGAPQAELVNTGSILAEPGSTIGITAGQVVNDGRMSADGGALVLNTQVTGIGSILIASAEGDRGSVTVEQIMGSGQTVLMHGGVLALASANNFLATLQDWDSGTTLALLHTHLTSADVTGNILQLHDGMFTEAEIKLAGHYTSADFHIANTPEDTAMVTTTHVGPWSSAV